MDNVVKCKLLFIISDEPYLGISASETLDAAMALASYGQTVSVWFSQNGVSNLFQKTDAKILNTHDHGLTLEGLDYFDIQEVLVTDLDYENYQLKNSKLRLQPKVIELGQMIKQLKQYKHIFRLS